MMKFAENFGTAKDETYGFVPPTFTLPGSQEMARLDAYMKAHPKATFIAKPQVGSQGDAISLFKELRDLPYGLDQKEVVVQRYLDKPLLLDEVKFDLRIYVAVFGVEEISAYICDEGLARFCTVSTFTHDFFRANMKRLHVQTSRKPSCTLLTTA